MTTHAAAAVDSLQVLILRNVLGDRGVLHIARCVAVAQAQTRRVDGYSPPADLLPAITLLAVAAQAAQDEADALAPRRAVRETEENGSAEVPRSRKPSESSPVEWINPKEAAQMLGCSDRNVRDLCTRGALESARKRGGRWVVDRAEIGARVEAGAHA